MMDPEIEVRKLPPSIIRELALILDYADSWKRLMAKIPKRLSPNGYKSDITTDNLAKYNSEHFKIIEQGGVQYKRSCTEILFDEWGTSGRPRASLGHLKYLLSKAELFRAADYVAKLLGEDPPPRPTTGPAAPVQTSIAEETLQADLANAEFERHLDEKNYPQEAIEIIRKKSLEVGHHPASPVIPEIVVVEVNASDCFQVPLVVPRAKTPPTGPEVSDMMKFSGESIEENLPDVVPEFSLLLDQESNDKNSGFSPAFSRLLSDPSESDASNYNSNTQNSRETSNLKESTIESDLIPALSALNPMEPQSGTDLIPNFDMLHQSGHSNYSSNIPSSIPHSEEANSKASSASSMKCPSPLPNLSLNTQLPHFSYSELEKTTNEFCSDPELGRFLGKGAFGSVFLAIGLLDKPVAVKKILLENVEIVNEGDEVTKQFRNEVEVLYKYKHENLVSLLGYSCDGCTYCLVYEYVPGGSLFDMLQKQPQNLDWKQRLHIGLGAAKAVAYLHTAFSTPLIHRDIKSANILLDAEKNAKLCDFGIVKLLPNQLADLETAPCGTSAYMSPEYHRGEISIKLDTFSFGVVLLELLTSLPALDYNRQGADLVTYVEDHCEDSVEPILDKTVGTWTKNGVNFAEEIYQLTLKCLEDKKRRPVMEDVVKLLMDIEDKTR